MNEGKTSAIFAVVAAISLGLAWWSRPDAISNETELKDEVTGQPVFAKFEDPGTASSLQIVKYDDALGQLERFEVAKDKTSNMWKLPSYDDYPADAAEQVRDATTPLISMPILSVASLDRGDHVLYGVVNPDEENLSVGESGVGMLVRVKGEANDVLAELVIGKEVEQAEGQRYVRVPTEDATYVVELNTAPFTTDFEKWINQQLLEVRGFDIAAVGLRDYAILPTQQGYGMSRNFDADLSYDSAKNAWHLDRLINYQEGKAVEQELAPGEKLQDKPLNDLRNTIQDLKIVNVRRKPTGLAADLKADKSLMENKESLQSLVSQGFIPQEGADGTEIFATGGETLVGTAAGVKYLLRFGEAVANLSSVSEAEEGSGLRRYLLVSAVLDESKFPPPDLEPLPETVAEMQARQAALDNPTAATSGDSADTTAPTESAGESPAVEAPPAPDEAAADPSDEVTTDDSPNADSQNAEGASDAEEAPAVESIEAEPSTTDPSTSLHSSAAVQFVSTQSDELSPTPEQATPDQAAPEQAAPEQAATEQAEPTTVDETTAPEAATDTASEAPAKSEEELQEQLEFVREQIAKENQRKIDARKENMEAARKRVQELNARFADWYYVVSDSVYKKLKISRDQLIGPDTPSAPPASPALPEGFNFGPQP